MKKIQIMGLAVVAMLVCSAFAASSAFAESEWLVSGAAPTAPVEVDGESIGAILLEDEAAPLGKSDIECTGVTSLGFVGASAAGVFSAKLDLVETTAFTVANCKIVSGACSSLDTVVGINLGWLTEIVLDGGVTFLDLILKEEGAGTAPGYLIECNTILGLVDDACTSEEGTTTLTNNMTAGDVVATFGVPSEAEKASCTLGNAKSGVVKGEVLFLTESGLSLAVS